MITALDSDTQPGSEMHILCQLSVAERVDKLKAGGFDASNLKNLKLFHHGEALIPWHAVNDEDL